MIHTLKYNDVQKVWEIGYWLTRPQSPGMRSRWDDSPKWETIWYWVDSRIDQVEAMALVNYLNGGDGSVL